jgi:hypothetical protein
MGKQKVTGRLDQTFPLNTILFLNAVLLDEGKQVQYLAR